MGTTGQKLTEVELAWAAGFIDGEGCFLFQKNCPTLKVSNTHLPTLVWLRDRFAGFIYNKGGNDPAHWRPRFTWVLSGKKAVPVIESIRPYLREKREQADLVCALRFLHPVLREAGLAELKRLKRPSFDLNDPLMEPKYAA